MEWLEEVGQKARLSDRGRAAIERAVWGDFQWTVPPNEEVWGEFCLALFEKGLRSKGLRSLTTTLRKFLKNLDEHFELRSLQHFPEVADRLSSSAHKQGGRAAPLVAEAFAAALRSVADGRGEALGPAALQERTRRVAQLLASLESWVAGFE